MTAQFRCPVCCGDGKETCTNPDHGFISALGSQEVGRLGCPCCGHDPEHKIPNGGDCEDCKGHGVVTKEVCVEILHSYDIDEDFEEYFID